MSRCWFVDDHRHLIEVQRLCELVELPRSTLYAWDNPTLSDSYLDDAWLANEVFDIHTASRGAYGAPRVGGQLRRHGHHVGRKRVARIMRQLGLVGAHGRKKWRRGNPNTALAGDLLDRDFTAAKPDERWVADISEFKCCDGKLFLAGIKDLHDRTVVGWSIGERQTTDLVINALVMPLARRQPDGEVIHHADRGPQFTSLEFSNRMTDWNLQASYGSTGDCLDNAAIESFWGALKRELRHIHGDLERFSRSEMRTSLFDRIDVFYNRQRHQAGLAHRTPAEVYAAAVA